MKKHIRARYSTVGSQTFPEPTIVQVYSQIIRGPKPTLQRTIVTEMSISEAKLLRDTLTVIVDRESQKMTISTDLQEAAIPEDVPKLLRNVATDYRETQSNLQASWSDPKAGRIWGNIANRLDRLATQIDNRLLKGY